jgi:hypothetical protein
MENSTSSDTKKGSSYSAKPMTESSTSWRAEIKRKIVFLTPDGGKESFSENGTGKNPKAMENVQNKNCT